MNLKEIKQLTDNLTNLDKWIGWLKEQSLEKLKKIKSATFSKLPKEFQYFLILEKFRKVHGGKYNYSKFTLNWFIRNYKNKCTKIPIVCSIHGEFYQMIDTHLRGQSCPKCAKEKLSNNKRLLYQEFIEKAKEVHRDKYQYLFDERWWNENYKGMRYTKIPIVCPIHGEFKQIVSNHLVKFGCPLCGREKSINIHKLSYQDFIRKAIQVHNDKYQYPFDKDWWGENYKNHKQKIPIVCPIHGEFFQSVSDHLQGHGCPKCKNYLFNKHYKMSYWDFINKTRRIHGDKYKYPDSVWWNENYENKNTKIPIICPQHGEFKQSVDSHLQGHGCPKCTSNYSKGEEELRQFIESLGFKTEKYRDNKFEIDIFIPELRIGFEYNGIYWHSDINKPKKYHQEKSLYFAEKSIILIHIWEDWWLYKKDIVKSFIRQKLGKVKNRIYARKCIVEEIDFRLAKQFLDENHIDGFTPVKLFIALKYENEIVSVISLKFWKQESRWEIDKFANKKDFVIVGGFSKLFKYFVSKYNPEWITTFSHIDLNNIKENVVYGKNGFKFVYITSPTYFYFDDNLIRRHRRFFQKKRLLKMFDWATIKMTEKEITDKAGFIRVYNSGNFKWEWRNECDKN